MGLEDFERELAEEKKLRELERKRQRSRSRERDDRSKDVDRHKHRHRHHHRSKYDAEEGSSRKHKRSRHDRGSSHERRSHRSRHHRSQSPTDRNREAAEEEEEDEWVEKETPRAPANDGSLEKALEGPREDNLKRDSWMEAPSALDIEYVERRRPDATDATTSHASKADFQLKIHKNELNHHLRDLKEDGEDGDDRQEKSAAMDSTLAGLPAQHEVNYTFGDAGSSWRMTKLKAVYRQAKETGRSIDEIALERYGDLRAFDDAREEEIELGRRSTLGKGYVGKIKPSGDLFQERKLEMGIHREPRSKERSDSRDELPQGEQMTERAPPARTVPLDQTALNKLKAQLMKAKLRNAPDVAELEARYNLAMAEAANRKEPEVVVLGTMESRMLAGGRKGEVKAVENKRGRERGLVEENEDMSIEDMVRQERRTRGQAGGEGLLLAERIAKDSKFDNDLEYLDENAAKLARRVAKSEINLRNTAIGDFQKMNRILDTCPLCHHEDTGTPPAAPLVSLATRIYLTLPTQPEISSGGACIVPIQHRRNLLECDEDEWEEIRNFMKCLMRMYDAQGRAVVFYENAAHPQRHRHAAMTAVPLPYSLGETAPAFFREAILSAAEEWSQHKKIIDTLAKARDGLGRLAFRKTLAKEMPYFHVWFTLDGGIGHIVEDAERWPRGDLFARETLGGMLDVGPEVVRRQGRWTKGPEQEKRVEAFRKGWRKWDWTGALTEG